MIAALCGCAGSGDLPSQTWVYNQPAIDGGRNDHGGGTSTRNLLVLYRRSESSDAGTLRIFGGMTERCLQSTLDVRIERTPDALVLLPQTTQANCYSTRIVIRRDGSGGTVERREFRAAEYSTALPAHDWGLRPQ